MRQDADEWVSRETWYTGSADNNPFEVPWDRSPQRIAAAVPPLAEFASRRSSGLPGGSRGSIARRLRRRRRAAFLAEEQRMGQRDHHTPSSAPTVEAAAGSDVRDASPYGEVMAQLEAGGQARCDAVQFIRGSVPYLAFDPFGCRVVQLALQNAPQREAIELVIELHGHVRLAIHSAHANYVIQKVVQVMPAAIASFIIEELAGVAVWAARHRFGCRIVCRLLEHHTGRQTGEGIASLIDEVLDDAVELCRSTYGHHVVNSILEHGSPGQRHTVAAALLRGDLVRNARSRHASYVIEKAFDFCGPEDRAALAEELLRNPEHLPLLAEGQFGSQVVKTLLRRRGEWAERATEQLRNSAVQLQASKHGRRVLEEIPL